MGQQDKKMKIAELLSERCWKGYKQVGGKKKGGRMVPNCVSVNEDSMKYILYLNGKPVASYPSQAEAQRQGQMIQTKYPDSSFEIKQEVCRLNNLQLSENLRDWFKEKWVRFNPQGKIMGPCARGSSKEGKPKCLPQAKAHALGKKGRASAAARKRKQDPNPDRKGKAINVKTKR